MGSKKNQMRRRWAKWLRIVLPLVMLAPCLRAQTMDDGIMLSKKKYCTGVFYTYDTWDHYWEGERFRSNANIGAVTTRTIAYIGNYGLTNRVNLLIDLPHVATSSSQGVLHGQSGWQDATFAVKVKALSLPVGNMGALRAIAVVSGSVPMGPYPADDEPMSIGSQSTRATGRGILNYLSHNGLYLNGGAAYTYRGNVQFSRPYYYTSGQLFLSSQVALPNVFDYNTSAGFRKNDTTLAFTYSQQETRGGGDIRQQDVPLVSNRVNATRVGGTVTLPLPRVRDLQYWAIYSYVLNGRNTGQANTATVGLLYTFEFGKKGPYPQ